MHCCVQHSVQMTHAASVNILVTQQMMEKFSLTAVSLQDKICLSAVIYFYSLYACLFMKRLLGHPFFNNCKIICCYCLSFIKQQPICFTLREHFSVLLK